MSDSAVGYLSDFLLRYDAWANDDAAINGGRCPFETEDWTVLADNIEEVLGQLQEAHVARIVAQNPGIDRADVEQRLEAAAKRHKGVLDRLAEND